MDASQAAVFPRVAQRVDSVLVSGVAAGTRKAGDAIADRPGLVVLDRFLPVPIQAAPGSLCIGRRRRRWPDGLAVDRLAVEPDVLRRIAPADLAQSSTLSAIYSSFFAGGGSISFRACTSGSSATERASPARCERNSYPSGRSESTQFVQRNAKAVASAYPVAGVSVHVPEVGGELMVTLTSASSSGRMGHWPQKKRG